MNVILDEKSPYQETQFPKLMIHKTHRVVILATEISYNRVRGIILEGGIYNLNIGVPCNWSLEYVDYHGTITLSNH